MDAESSRETEVTMVLRTSLCETRRFAVHSRGPCGKSEKDQVPGFPKHAPPLYAEGAIEEKNVGTPTPLESRKEQVSYGFNKFTIHALTFLYVSDMFATRKCYP